LVESLDYHLNWLLPRVWLEVEGMVVRSANPLGHITIVSNTAPKGDYSDWSLDLAGNIAHPANHNLHSRASLTQELNHIGNKKANLLKTLSCLPPSADNVPRLWCSHDDIKVGQLNQVFACLTTQA
jgi:hypothetical protein